MEPEQRNRLYWLSRLSPGICWLILVIISGLFFMGTIIVERRATKAGEKLWNEQQTAMTRLAGHALRDHFAMLISESGILAGHALAEFAQGQQDIGGIADRLQSALSSHPDILAYTVVDSAGELIYARGAETDEFGVNLSLQWAQQYWPEIEKLKSGPFVPPMHVTPERQLLGLLFPVRTPDGLSGALVVVADISPVAAGLTAPLHPGWEGEIFLVDGRGRIVHHPQPAMIGAGAERLKLPRRLFTEPSGSEFSPEDTLIAWDTVTIGGEKMVIALAAANSAIDRIIRDIRLQCTASGGVFLLLLIGGITIMRRRARPDIPIEDRPGL